MQPSSRVPPQPSLSLPEFRTGAPGTGMGFFDRLFGWHKVSGPPRRVSPLSLQLLFPSKLRLDAQALTEALRGFHPSLSQARFEPDSRASTAMGAEVGVARWEKHAVQVVLFGVRMPTPTLEQCVAPAHYSAELKTQARAHTAHALLFYVGEEQDPLEQYVALALVAVALAKQGAILVLNESAHTSFPTHPLLPDKDEDLLDLLRTMPLTALYVGFVKLQVPGVEGVWLRTYGAPRMGLPDLAWHARNETEAYDTFELFSGLLEYLRKTGARFAKGHTAEWQRRHVKIRGPRWRERKFLDSPGTLFVLEPREFPGSER
ncbi:hypothetical protein [Hyalangium versicolor]|uniref:hypothetical protein n=1 Tax=Hyalangium versicolor TaxID=2861190 RepID=UPI001CCD462B|nr:hypothetical protein [Hyalangium versicolor]